MDDVTLGAAVIAMTKQLGRFLVIFLWLHNLIEEDTKMGGCSFWR